MEKTKVVANLIVKKIIFDLTDRRGLRQEWDQIDQDIKNEIIMKWEQIALKEIKKRIKK